jgi:signal transduction histidine kinase
MFLLFAGLWPVSLVTGYVYSGGHHPRALLVRILGLGTVSLWLLLRRRPSHAEWVAIWTLAVLGWIGTQYAVGPGYAGVFAINVITIFMVVTIAFDRFMVGYVAFIATCAYAIGQLHFHPTGRALLAVLMFVIVEAIVVLVVGGTAHFLRDSLRDVNELHTRMAETADRERARIAGALHDDTLQVLTAASLSLDGIARRLQHGETAAAGDAVLQVRDMVQGASERTRRLSFDLYPTQLGDRGLGLAIEALGQQISGEEDLQVEVDAPDLRYPPDVERLAYRTIRELLLNARKHAQATCVAISVAADTNRLHCRVADDGRGFDAATWDKARRDHHMGLDATGERVRMAGGEFAVESEPGRGTRASFSLPIHQAQAV